MLHAVRPLLAPTLACLALLATSASAWAVPTVRLDRSCYAHLPGKGSEPVVATITGGTPNADFILTANGRNGAAGSTAGTFDLDGNATAQIDGITMPSGSINPSKGESLSFTIQDFGGDGAEVPVATAKVTNIAITIASKPVNPRKARLIRASAGGAFANKTLYGFITKRGSSKVLKRFRVGRANGCGFISKRAVVAPPSRRPGNYVLYINAGPRLSKPNALAFTFRIFRF